MIKGRGLSRHASSPRGMKTRDEAPLLGWFRSEQRPCSYMVQVHANKSTMEETPILLFEADISTVFDSTDVFVHKYSDTYGNVSNYAVRADLAGEDQDYPYVYYEVNENNPEGYIEEDVMDPSYAIDEMKPKMDYYTFASYYIAVRNEIVDGVQCTVYTQYDDEVDGLYEIYVNVETGLVMYEHCTYPVPPEPVVSSSVVSSEQSSVVSSEQSSVVSSEQSSVVSSEQSSVVSSEQSSVVSSEQSSVVSSEQSSVVSSEQSSVVSSEQSSVVSSEEGSVVSSEQSSVVSSEESSEPPPARFAVRSEEGSEGSEEDPVWVEEWYVYSYPDVTVDSFKYDAEDLPGLTNLDFVQKGLQRDFCKSVELPKVTTAFTATVSSQGRSGQGYMMPSGYPGFPPILKASIGGVFSMIYRPDKIYTVMGEDPWGYGLPYELQLIPVASVTMGQCSPDNSTMYALTGMFDPQSQFYPFVTRYFEYDTQTLDTCEAGACTKYCRKNGLCLTLLDAEPRYPVKYVVDSGSVLFGTATPLVDQCVFAVDATSYGCEEAIPEVYEQPEGAICAQPVSPTPVPVPTPTPTPVPNVDASSKITVHAAVIAAFAVALLSIF